MIRTILLTFAMYTRIPMPQFEAGEKEMRGVLCAFPLVGIVMGAAEAGLLFLLRRLEIPTVAAAALLMALPVLLDGGIHLDGLMDTADARHSFLPKEEKQRILKDPHTGAFAVIRLLLYLLLVFACGAILWEKAGNGWSELLFCGSIFVIARCVSAVSGLLLPGAKKEGMLASVKGEGGKLRALIPGLFLAVTAAVLFFLNIKRTLLILLVQTVLFFAYARMTKKEFGGVSGDTAGWLLCMSELLGLAAMAAAVLI